MRYLLYHQMLSFRLAHTGFLVFSENPSIIFSSVFVCISIIKATDELETGPTHLLFLCVLHHYLP